MRVTTWLAGGSASILCAGLVLAPATVGAAGDPAPSVNAPLPAKAYAGLACDPFDGKLRKTSLANGVGPEARVAAACWALEWRARGKARLPKVTVTVSETFPRERAVRLEKGIAAGHRLFGRFADVTHYIALASRDAAYSCSKGEQITGGSLSYPWGERAWDQHYNSGCRGTDYSPSGWTSGLLGTDNRTFFAWTLTESDADNHFADDNALGPMWFLGAVSHEYAHNIQMQRSLGATNGQESIGRWYGEGQAQYLGNTAASWTIGPKDMRSAQLRQLREVMREERVKVIDLEAMENDWRTNLVYPAGYFAYEWLVAHYGIEATFTWWNAWNTDCERPGSGECWRAKSEELFGMSASELRRTLNDHVNAQVKG